MKIKKLIWLKNGNHNGEYAVIPIDNEKEYIISIDSVLEKDKDKFSIKYYVSNELNENQYFGIDSIEEARQVAQKDFEESIMKCLDNNTE